MGHQIIGQQVLMLLSGIPDDEAQDLDARASSHRVGTILKAMRDLADDLAAGREPPESDELHDIANAAARGPGGSFLRGERRDSKRRQTPGSNAPQAYPGSQLAEVISGSLKWCHESGCSLSSVRSRREFRRLHTGRRVGCCRRASQDPRRRPGPEDVLKRPIVSADRRSASTPESAWSP